MAEAWYNQPEVRSILDGLTHQDLSIIQVKDHFEWDIPVVVDARVEMWHEKTVTEQLGYSLEDAKGDEDREERWFSFYESQASVNDVLIQRFGDPNLLFAFGLDRANKIWSKDPLSLLRKRKKR